MKISKTHALMAYCLATMLCSVSFADTCVSVGPIDGKMGGTICFPSSTYKVPDTTPQGFAIPAYGPSSASSSSGSGRSEYSRNEYQTPRANLPASSANSSSSRQYEYVPSPKVPNYSLNVTGATWVQGNSFGGSRSISEQVASEAAASNINAAYGYYIILTNMTSQLDAYLKFSTQDLEKYDAAESKKIHDRKVKYQLQILETEKTLTGPKFSRTFTRQNGLINSRHIKSFSMRALSANIKLKSTAKSQNGANVRKIINRALIATTTLSAAPRAYNARMCIALAVGGDLAEAAGKTEAGTQILKASLVALDIAIGFVPVIGSVNEATQLMFGMFTGFDYTGHRMYSADYALRGVGIVLGLLPFYSKGVLSFGVLAIDRTAISVANIFRRLPLAEKIERFVPSVNLVRNSVGAVGSGLGDLIKYQRLFASDTSKFVFMAQAMERYEFTRLTVAGRALTKHPELLGYASTEDLRKVYRTEIALNEAASEYVSNALKRNQSSLGFASKIREPTIEFVGENGMAVRYSAETKRFIGFIEKAAK